MKSLPPERQAKIKAIVNDTMRQIEKAIAELPPERRDAVLSDILRDIRDRYDELVEKILAEEPLPDFLEKLGKPRSE